MNRIANRIKKQANSGTEQMSQAMLDQIIKQVDKQIEFYSSAVERMEVFNTWLQNFQGVDDLKTIFQNFAGKIEEVKIYIESNKGNVQKCDLFKKDNGTSTNEQTNETQQSPAASEETQKAAAKNNRIMERISQKLNKKPLIKKCYDDDEYGRYEMDDDLYQMNQNEADDYENELDADHEIKKQAIYDVLDSLYEEAEKDGGRSSGLSREFGGYKIEISSWWSGTFKINGEKYDWNEAIEFLLNNENEK